MAQTLMKQLAAYEGYCCVYLYIKSFAGQESATVARRLGVSRNAISIWRKRIRNGEVVCGHGCTACGKCENSNKPDTDIQNTP